VYQDWRIKRWDTPIADINAIGLVSLTDASRKLEIVVEAFRQPIRSRWRFTFTSYPCYRNIMEEYRLSLWKYLDDSNQRCGFTFTVEQSPWIASFEPSEPLLAQNHKKLRHFVICTEDDILEVISNDEPQIESIAPAPVNAPEPGKSQHLYYPTDKEKINQLVEKVRGRQNPAGREN
jgi:hypothetical protein